MAPTPANTDEQQGNSLPPFRSMQDFLTDARFSTPTFNDPERMKNRMVQNLLYYQTNYFVVASLALFAVCAVSPRDFLHGGLGISLIVSAYIYASKNQESIRKFRDENPLVGAVLVLSVGLMMLHFSGKMMIFLGGTSLPIVGTLVHAACRMRNMLNKINTLSENLGLKKTPMGLLLECFGHSFESDARRSAEQAVNNENTQASRRSAMQSSGLEEAMQAASGFRRVSI